MTSHFYSCVSYVCNNYVQVDVRMYVVNFKGYEFSETFPSANFLGKQWLPKN